MMVSKVNADASLMKTCAILETEDRLLSRLCFVLGRLLFAPSLFTVLEPLEVGDSA